MHHDHMHRGNKKFSSVRQPQQPHNANFLGILSWLSPLMAQGRSIAGSLWQCSLCCYPVAAWGPVKRSWLDFLLVL